MDRWCGKIQNGSNLQNIYYRALRLNDYVIKLIFYVKKHGSKQRTVISQILFILLKINIQTTQFNLQPQYLQSPSFKNRQIDCQDLLSLIIKTNRLPKYNHPHQIYKCQCGREYLAFSALYLHVNLKHNKRLTKRKNESNCKIQKINNKTVVTYFLNRSQNITRNQYNNHNNHQKDFLENMQLQKKQIKTAIIRQYLAYLQRKKVFGRVAYHIIEKVMHSFIDYFNFIEALTADNQGGNEEGRYLTEYFNDFSVYYLPVLEKKISYDLQTVVIVLHTFYLWLKEKSYTYMYLVCNPIHERIGLQQ